MAHLKVHARAIEKATDDWMISGSNTVSKDRGLALHAAVKAALRLNGPDATLTISGEDAELILGLLPHQTGAFVPSGGSALDGSDRLSG